jgi:hypothetical protein
LKKACSGDILFATWPITSFTVPMKRVAAGAVLRRSYALSGELTGYADAGARNALIARAATTV